MKGRVPVFSTREISLLVWGLFLILFALSLKDVRNSLVGVLSSFFKLLTHSISVFIIIYIGSMFYFMYFNKLLENSIIKDYLVWLFFALLPLIGKTISEFSRIEIKSLILSTFKFSIIPLFIVNEYTFSLWVELILVPIVSFITMLLAFAETDPKFSQVFKFLNFILGVTGFIILYFALKGFIGNISDIKQVVFWEKMFIDIIGIALHFPLLLIVQILCFYEHIIIRTNLSSKKEKLMALFILFKRFSIRKSKLVNVMRNLNLRRVKTAEEFSKILDQSSFVDIA